MFAALAPGGALLAVAYIGFISLGLPDAVLGVAWPSMRVDFNLTQGAMGSALLALSVGFFISSWNSGWLIARIGVGWILLSSTALMALALAGYGLAPIWPVVLACAVLVGLGSGAVDTGLNAYAAAYFRPRHMNWLHACWGIGALCGPLIVTGVLAADISWRWAYAIVAACLALLTLLFWRTLPLWRQPASAKDAPDAPPISALAVLRRPRVWLQISLFFCYSGLEVAAGQWSFTLFTEARGMTEVSAGLWVTFYWTSLTAGRFLFGFVVERLGAEQLLRYSLLAAVSSALLLTWAPTPWLGGCGLLLLGLALAPVFPCLMTETPVRLGAAHATHAIGFQTSAAVAGIATLPGVIGLLAGTVGLEVIGVGLLVLASSLWLCHEWLVTIAAGTATGSSRF